METIGWISATLFALCAVPAAYEAIRKKTCDISSLFLFMWLSGEITGLVYAYHLESLPLAFNYVVNTICILILINFNRRKT
jgi:uncharacterized protein with PQ loop repeat